LSAGGRIYATFTLWPPLGIPQPIWAAYFELQRLRIIFEGESEVVELVPAGNAVSYRINPAAAAANADQASIL
jgi:hypothetical protein